MKLDGLCTCGLMMPGIANSCDPHIHIGPAMRRVYIGSHPIRLTDYETEEEVKAYFDDIIADGKPKAYQA